jgi:hypothetical protein
VSRGARKHPDAITLALFAGGDLDWMGRLRAGWHVRGCRRCHAEVRTLERLRDDVRSASGEMPPGLDWNRLSEEMTGNIRVGLAAGECVGDFPAGRRLPRLRWNGAMAAALIAGLFIAGFWMNLPGPQAAHLLTALGRITHRGPAPDAQPAVEPAPSASDSSVLLASPDGIEWKANGASMGFRPADPDDVTLTVSTQGSVSARVVDIDTGQATITRVYDAQ